MTDADPEEEENYFISLSDLMTGVVFIFVILLCAFAFHYQSEAKTAADAAKSASELEAKANEASKQAEEERKIAQAERKRAEAATEEARIAKVDAEAKGAKIDALSRLLKDRDSALQKNLRDLESKLRDRGVRVILDSRSGVIRLPEELLFARGSDVLSVSGHEGLKILAEELVPVIKAGCEESALFRLESVFIEGHTDVDPIRSARFADNWDLSAARATSTFRAIVAANPELEEFRNPTDLRILGVSGYGQNRPVEKGESEEEKKRNRRVDLRFLMAHPTDEDIERAKRKIENAETDGEAK